MLETGELAGGRACSMVNFSSEADRHALALKLKPGGRFSDWLYAKRKTIGKWPYSVRSVAPSVAGTKARTSCASPAARKSPGSCRSSNAQFRRITFAATRARSFWRADLQDALYLEPLARYIAASHDNLEVTIALSDEVAMTAFHVDYPVLRLRVAWFTRPPARRSPGGARDAIAFVAGPPIMVDGAIRGLIICGMPSQDIRYDKLG